MELFHLLKGCDFDVAMAVVAYTRAREAKCDVLRCVVQLSYDFELGKGLVVLACDGLDGSGDEMEID